MRTLVSILGLWMVIRLVYREKAQLIGSVRTDITPQSFVSDWTGFLLLIRRPGTRPGRLRADISRVL